MVVDSILPHAERGPNDHRKDASPFTIEIDIRKKVWNKLETNPEISSIFELYGSDESYMLKLINVEWIEVYRYWYLYYIVNEFVSEFYCLLILLRCIFLLVREHFGECGWSRTLLNFKVKPCQKKTSQTQEFDRGLIFKSDSQRTRFPTCFITKFTVVQYDCYIMTMIIDYLDRCMLRTCYLTARLEF